VRATASRSSTAAPRPLRPCTSGWPARDGSSQPGGCQPRLSSSRARRAPRAPDLSARRLRLRTRPDDPRHPPPV